MAQFVVRNLEDDVREKLRNMAQKQGQSMEETVREILRRAVARQNKPRPRLGSRLAQRFVECGLEVDEEIAELRDQQAELPSFDG